MLIILRRHRQNVHLLSRSTETRGREVEWPQRPSRHIRQVLPAESLFYDDVTVVALSKLLKERCMAEEKEMETMTDEEFA